ncbi:thiamine phosphate synthase [Psychroflexus montanilacus]|uniref:thiamine phosphate synthase n=1 Tax=Psychroflexus montanilacus TaxID=2873598 RepID=UPI001CCFA749|nr:thiamine phosphate synthase [Psychroflexus montanilacus]MBZ9651908.1 thiamine phosphate synthase [Psychroflexus montanilacus]
MKSLQGIYAITDEVLTPKLTILQQVEEALDAGAKVIQLRDKSSTDAELENTAKALQQLCSKKGATFFINDRVQLARNIGADGVHVGFSDQTVRETRKVVGGQMLIGVSCYGDLERAKQAVQDGADYVAFGAFYPSKTKPKADVVSKEVISEAKKQLDVPVCVIGGIHRDNIAEIAAYQPDLYALVSDIFGSGDIKTAVTELVNNLSKSE